MRRSLLALLLLAAISAALGACKAGGQYESTARAGGADRGETNGRTFELISHKPDDEEWQIRVRDSSLWIAYAAGAEDAELGTVNLDAKETEKLWEKIDEVDLGGRDTGEPDDDAGYLQLRLREPGGDEGHELISIYVSRKTEDEAIVDLGAYLQKLIRKYHKKEVEF